MKHLFVTYKIAKQLKEKGFVEECFGYYNGRLLQINGMEILHELSLSDINTDAPLYQQVVDWFREKHKLFIEVRCWNNLYSFALIKVDDMTYHFDSDTERTGYYLTLQDAILEALKLI
jgi:hypothetical protein